ncbi:hypothetical protein, partial [Arthrobacter sp. SO3]|uniref:hypothetical protein n=1 Tax=Arthrobacter sp. SO3 TaxID=1897057 RepID=UPI001CFFC993
QPGTAVRHQKPPLTSHRICDHVRSPEYGTLFNFGYTAIQDSDGETFYFVENPDRDGLKAQFAYLVADPQSTSADRSQAANQAVVAEMLKLLVRSAGSASDELAVYAIGVVEDALSMSNRSPAVLSDAYRAVLANTLRDFGHDGADPAVLDRLESLVLLRSTTRLIVDAEGVARPDAGMWS